MLINNFIFSEHSGFMHIAKFNCACLKTLKTGPAMAGLAGPTPTALKHHNLNPQSKAISTTINTVKPLAYKESVT